MPFEKSITARVAEIRALMQKPTKTIRDLNRISRFRYLLNPTRKAS